MNINNQEPMAINCSVTRSLFNFINAYVERKLMTMCNKINVTTFTLRTLMIEFQR